MIHDYLHEQAFPLIPLIICHAHATKWLPPKVPDQPCRTDHLKSVNKIAKTSSLSIPSSHAQSLLAGTQKTTTIACSSDQSRNTPEGEGFFAPRLHRVRCKTSYKIGKERRRRECNKEDPSMFGIIRSKCHIIVHKSPWLDTATTCRALRHVEIQLRHWRSQVAPKSLSSRLAEARSRWGRRK